MYAGFSNITYFLSRQNITLKHHTENKAVIGTLVVSTIIESILLIHYQEKTAQKVQRKGK